MMQLETVLSDIDSCVSSSLQSPFLLAVRLYGMGAVNAEGWAS